MTFNVPSFFAGVGTVLLTLIVGFGGGVLMTGTFTDRPREPNKLERRATEEIRPEAKPPTIVAAPVTAAPAPVAEQPVPAAQTPAKPAEPPAEPPKATEPPKAQPAEPKPVRQAEPQPAPAPAPPAPPSIQTAQTADQQPAAQPKLGPQRPVALVQPGNDEQARDARDASRKEAKARAEKRKAERRKQIAEQRMQQRMRQEQQKAVAERLRRDTPDEDDEDSDQRPIFTQRDRGPEPPPFRLFSFGD